MHDQSLFLQKLLMRFEVRFLGDRGGNRNKNDERVQFERYNIYIILITRNIIV